MDQGEDSQFALDEAFGQDLEDTTAAIILIDRLQGLVNAICKGQKDAFSDTI